MPICYLQNKQVIQSNIGDEVVMLDMESGFYFGLNSVASVIWNHMKEPVTMDALVDKLTEKFEVSRETCEADTRELISQMLAKGIIREVS